jgi:DNA-binding transcriptional ArsR family regulator
MTSTSFNSTAPDDDARLEKTRQHFAWQEYVSRRSDLSPATRLAAWALALRRNAKTGRSDPSYADMAEGMGGVSERTAMRAVRVLERTGLIALVRDHGRRTSSPS